MPKGNIIRIAPHYINVYYNLANLIRIDPERLQEAYDMYQKAISMKPDFVNAHMNRGDVLMKMGRVPEAIEAFKKALEHDPSYSDALFNLGSAQMQVRG